jgi:uncharacterized membrane protein
MDLYLLYTLFKYLHILGAIAWIGGGVTLCFLGLTAAAQKQDAQMLQVLQSVGVLANRWFVPASLITLLCGIAMATIGNLWRDGWIVLGLVGFAATFVTGHFGLRPVALKIQALVETGDIAAGAAQGRRLLQVAKFDYTMLAMVVADMVLKPQWTDLPVIGGILCVLLLAATLFLVPLFVRPAEASAA